MITHNTIIKDVVDDIIYHYDKYVDYLICKFHSAQELCFEILEDKILYSSLCSYYLQEAAILLIVGRYSAMLDMMHKIPDNYFANFPVSKIECINNAEILIEEYKNEFDS